LKVIFALNFIPDLGSLSGGFGQYRAMRHGTNGKFEAEIMEERQVSLNQPKSVAEKRFC
jgi:hypothetical protein